MALFIPAKKAEVKKNGITGIGSWFRNWVVEEQFNNINIGSGNRFQFQVHEKTGKFGLDRKQIVGDILIMSNRLQYNLLNNLKWYK